MKKFLFMCLVALVPMAFTACGSDDDDNKPNNEQTTPTGGTVTSSISETSNQIVLTVTVTEQGLKMTTKYIFDFQNDVCTKATCQIEYPTEALAQASYNELMEDLDEDEDPSIYSIKGKVVSSDMTASFKGQSMAAIKVAVEILRKQLEKEAISGMN